MKDEKVIKKACDAGRASILNQLGREVTADDLLEVMLMFSHSLLTGSGSLSLEQSNHNADLFHRDLKKLISVTQCKVAPVSNRLM